MDENLAARTVGKELDQAAVASDIAERKRQQQYNGHKNAHGGRGVPENLFWSTSAPASRQSRTPPPEPALSILIQLRRASWARGAAPDVRQIS
ncbi:hypothetical protein [Nocardia stercoris]|uniref:hypothetical protein n=1 Tax=Nocardia stercoris TaxID=2483361 RepID=UPI0011C3A85B|nr:hypothetical protein [Nocardia stercoris]